MPNLPMTLPHSPGVGGNASTLRHLIRFCGIHGFTIINWLVNLWENIRIDQQQ
ncbi:hypothetical protein [Phytoactinopolyspora limicola]|uniref:hypothetical protein n=1 Tax=Phytoactinopolyspora limicola TaxID=2715536 RepID=UPI00140E1DA7|nr:hypothetical protein [Phytoactinopolyspora limicola]